MKSILVVLIIFSLCIFISCNKVKTDQPARFCWQIVEYSGIKVNVICDKTEAELIQCVRDGSCPIYAGITQFTSCNYYQIGGDKFCWLINGHSVDSITENEAKLISNCFYGGLEPTRTDCRNCQWWFHRERRMFKPNNTVTYSQVTHEYFCGDTTKTLFQERQIVIKDDADSLVSIQFSYNGTSW